MRKKIRALIQIVFEETKSTCATIAQSFDAIESEIKKKPQEKQLFLDAFEKEIEPIAAVLHQKLGI